MAKLHTVIIETKRPDPIKTYNVVRSYVATLEKAAAFLEKDRSAGAHYAIAATVRFLVSLKQPPHLIVPLYEAAQIIQRDMGGEITLAKQRRERDLNDSLALEVQLRCKVSMKDALRQIVGNDPVAATHLRDFRRNLKAKKSLGTPARIQFDAMMAKYFRGIPSQDAMKRALGVSASMRGKEESVKR